MDIVWFKRYYSHTIGCNVQLTSVSLYLLLCEHRTAFNRFVAPQSSLKLHRRVVSIVVLQWLHQYQLANLYKFCGIGSLYVPSLLELLLFYLMFRCLVSFALIYLLAENQEMNGLPFILKHASSYHIFLDSCVPFRQLWVLINRGSALVCHDGRSLGFHFQIKEKVGYIFHILLVCDMVGLLCPLFWLSCCQHMI